MNQKTFPLFLIFIGTFTFLVIILFFLASYFGLQADQIFPQLKPKPKTETSSSGPFSALDPDESTNPAESALSSSTPEPAPASENLNPENLSLSGTSTDFTSSQAQSAGTDFSDNYFTFAVFGDSESYDLKSGYNNELPIALKTAQQLRPDLVFFTGDIIVGSEKRIEELKPLLDQYFSNYYIVLDKHDYECGEKCIKTWQQVFWGGDGQAIAPLYFSFDHKNTHFSLLSTSYPKKYAVDIDQRSWLKTDLTRAGDKTLRIVLTHVPPVTFFEESAKKCHDMSCNEKDRQALINVFEEGKVNLVISGHEHSFAHRRDGEITYLLGGNIGNHERYDGQVEGNYFTFYTVRGTSVRVQLVDIEGAILEDIMLF